MPNLTLKMQVLIQISNLTQNSVNVDSNASPYTQDAVLIEMPNFTFKPSKC